MMHSWTEIQQKVEYSDGITDLMCQQKGSPGNDGILNLVKRTHIGDDGWGTTNLRKKYEMFVLSSVEGDLRKES